MKDIYRINSSDLRIGGLMDVFIPLERTLKNLNIDFYFIGAIARDMMTLVHKEKLFKATMDIDVAVMVSSIEEYEEIRRTLIERENFVEDKSEPYRLYFNDKIIDILPFGGLENTDGIVTLEGRDLVSISVLGLKEVYGLAETLVVDNRLEFAVSSLAGLCILKLVAFSERPDRRAKDIYDFNFIVERYADMNLDYICDCHHDIMNNGWNEELSARVLGRDIAAIISEEEIVKKKILEILDENISRGYDSRIVQIMAMSSNKNLEEKLNTINAIKRGILDKIDN